MGKEAVKGTSKGSKLDVGMKISPAKERFNGLAEGRETGIVTIAGEERIKGLFLSGSSNIDAA